MNSQRHDDPLLHALATMPRVTPEAGHAEHVRTRCRAQLEAPAPGVAVVLEPAAVGSCCALYAWQIARFVTKIGTP